MPRTLLILLLLAILHPVFADITLEQAKTNGMLETLKNYIEHSDNIVDICVYEQEWVSSTGKSHNGLLIQRAVVTGTHKGNIAIGTKLEYSNLIEDSPMFFSNFRSTVEGDLCTFFFDKRDTREVEGKIVITGDARWWFSRVGDIFSELFTLEEKTNPHLQK